MSIMNPIRKFLQIRKLKKLRKSIQSSWVRPYKDHPPIPDRIYQNTIHYKNLLTLDTKSALTDLLNCYGPRFRTRLHKDTHIPIPKDIWPTN